MSTDGGGGREGCANGVGVRWTDGQRDRGWWCWATDGVGSHPAVTGTNLSYSSSPLAGATTSATKKSNFAPNSIIERVGCGVVGGVIGASVPITPKLTTINCGSCSKKTTVSVISFHGRHPNTRAEGDFRTTAALQFLIRRLYPSLI